MSISFAACNGEREGAPSKLHCRVELTINRLDEASNDPAEWKRTRRREEEKKKKSGWKVKKAQRL